MADVDAGIYAVVASVRYKRGQQGIPTVIKLTKSKKAAQAELRRMVGVVLREKSQVEMGPEDMNASVYLKEDLAYFFYVSKADWISES